MFIVRNLKYKAVKIFQVRFLDSQMIGPSIARVETQGNIFLTKFNRFVHAEQHKHMGTKVEANVLMFPCTRKSCPPGPAFCSNIPRTLGLFI